MGIKKKKPGPVPLFQERWKEIAKDGARLSEAARMYLEETKTNSLTVAFREVKAFHAYFMKTFRGR